MNSRDLLSISMIVSFELMFQVIHNPILKFIKIYFQAIIIFLFTVQPGKNFILLLIFDTSRTILEIMINYGFYIAIFEALIKVYPIKIYMNSWNLLLFFIICVPFMKISTLYMARATIKRLKIHQRIGV